MPKIAEQVKLALNDIISSQKPQKILLVSSFDELYGNFIKKLYSSDSLSLVLDRVMLSENSDTTPNNTLFRRSYSDNSLHDDNLFEKYDFILVTDIIEDLPVDTSLKLIKKLLKFAQQSVLVITPLNCPSNASDGISHTYRKIHPTVFCKFDFSYSLISGYQFYNFFPQDLPLRDQNYDVADCGNFTGRKLKIAYLLPHKNLTGGVKCLLEQMRQLHRKGHCVYAIYKNGPNESDNRSAVPAWSDLNPRTDLDGEIVLKQGENYTDFVENFDVVMLGFMNQLADFIHYSGTTSLVYWEQGYEGIYGNFGKLVESNNNILTIYRKLYGVNISYLAVSEIVADILKSKYGIQADVLHNGIDTEFYSYCGDRIYDGTILLVGNPALKFKGFEFALQVLNRVWSLGYRFKVNWACQVKPNVQNAPFPIEYYVLQPQNVLAKLYREADIFLFSSLYESFPMPPFEAMASGVPVVATECGGIHTYAVPDENILLVSQGDVEATASAVIKLMSDNDLRKKLSVNGRKTAEKFSFSRIASDIERYFYAIVNKKNSSRMLNGINISETAKETLPMTVQKYEKFCPKDFTFDPQTIGQHELMLLLVRMSNGNEDGNDLILESVITTNRFTKETIETLIKKFVPFKAKAYNAVGVAFYNTGKKQTAAEFFSTAYAEDKKYRDAAFNLAYCLVEYKEKALALKVISDCGFTDNEMMQLKNLAMMF